MDLHGLDSLTGEDPRRGPEAAGPYEGERYRPNWLSPEGSFAIPGTSTELLGTRRALISFSRASHQGLVGAFGLQEEKEAPLLPGALAGKLGQGVALYHAYFGAPATGMLMEALIAAGVDDILQVGMAGSISPACRIGDLFLPTWGIREEGTSYHYLPADVACTVSEQALARLRGWLQDMSFREGGVWTTDAPYRETRDKVREYARRGVLAVEMECTALMAIAMVRQVQFAAVMVITDELFGEAWEQGFSSGAVMERGERLCQALAEGFRCRT